MPEAVIVAAARTPIGRAYKGSLADVDAFELAEVAVASAVHRSGIPADDIDDLVVAESLQGGGVIARHTAVRLGMPRCRGWPTTATARPAWARCRSRPAPSARAWTRSSSPAARRA